MAKRTSLTRIIVSPVEIVSPRERQLAALRGRIRASDAVLSLIAEHAFGADRGSRSLVEVR